MVDVLNITMDTPTNRRNQEKITLHVGDIDTPDAEEFFAHSKCHLLACAVNHVAGWRIAHLVVKGTNCWHVGVINDRGTFVDIKGPQPLDDAKVDSRYQDDEVVATIVDSPVELYPLLGAPLDDPLWWFNDGGFTFEEGVFSCVGEVVVPFANALIERYRWA